MRAALGIITLLSTSQMLVAQLRHPVEDAGEAPRTYSQLVPEAIPSQPHISSLLSRCHPGCHPAMADDGFRSGVRVDGAPTTPYQISYITTGDNVGKFTITDITNPSNTESVVTLVREIPKGETEKVVFPISGLTLTLNDRWTGR